MKGQDARDYDVLYGADEFNEVLAQELARYRATIEGSEWPSDFRDADPFYALLQGGCWDDGLRSKLAEQLKEPAHLSYFCALFAPPGHSFGKGTMGCFVDEAQLTALLDESDEEDPYLLGCRQRVRALMAGKHWSEVD